MMPTFFNGRQMPEDLKTGQGGVPWSDDQYCMVCGKANPIGLKLEFHIEGRDLVTEWTAEKRFQGYADVLHGGMISTILDETMVNLPWKRDGVPVISAELNVRFIKPAKIGDKLIFRAEADDVSKRIISTKGICKTADGTLIAEATAKCVKIKNPNL
jgi:uncharacterized protein (TIGR00369 family)